MITKNKHILLSTLSCILCFGLMFSQQDMDLEENKKQYKKLAFYDYRGTNAIDVAVGSAVINGGHQTPEFDIYFRLGYKRHLTSHLNINLSYNKYNLVYKDIYNEGFMSFDLNLEYIISPYKRFTPYIYGGYGYNASNYFEDTTTKAQGGLGLEWIIFEGVGIKLFGEYNYTFSDKLDGLEAGESDDTFFRMGFGVNFYFGGTKKKERLKSRIKTVINSNPIIPDS